MCYYGSGGQWQSVCSSGDHRESGNSRIKWLYCGVGIVALAAVVVGTEQFGASYRLWVEVLESSLPNSVKILLCFCCISFYHSRAFKDIALQQH